MVTAYDYIVLRADEVTEDQIVYYANRSVGVIWVR